MGCVSARILFEDEEVKKPITKRYKNPKLMTGDITKKNESKLEREQAMKLRQQDRITAAEEISLRTLDEKERLSLGTRSRGTSRVSSRAGSPTQARKVHFKTEDGDKKQKNNNDQQSTKQVQYELPLQNGDVDNQSKHKKKKHSKNSVKPITDKSTNDNKIQQPITNNNTGEVSEKEVKQLEKKLSTIDERASSRNSGKSDEVKR
ncbi:eukaryotic translation initiation factor 5B-like [Mytilus californianus]|uniref:eukaryotic translation initiation factor 5B-like n=1 Tax=Mytilus californianus TaxID=6549 RepID=UPI002245F238|nr:eukaryotic translation initiation factor 5B-like [Mytilus californianus]